MQRLFVICVIVLGSLSVLRAGNPDRAGEAGAYELKFDPWVKNAGVYSMNSSRVTGLESMRVNVAGLPLLKARTEVLVARTHYLQGTELYFIAAGVAQKFGKDKSNAVGLTFMSLDFGEIEKTTTSQPEGGLGTYKPQFFNIGIAYAKSFSSSIHGGITVRIISERIEDVKAFGFAVDLGLQYVTGPLDNIRFGISLRNVGAPMRYSGDGLVFRGEAPEGDYFMTQSQRTEKFELPTQLNIGASYDLYADNLKNDKDFDSQHRISIMFNFTSNSFGKDQVGGGLEYSWRELFAIRAGYRWEKGLTGGSESNTTLHKGIAAGFSANVPLKKKTSEKENPATLGIDYAYKVSDPFSGTHSYGLRFTF